MSKIVGQLKAILGLDKTKYDRGLNDAEKKSNKFSSGIKKLAGVMAAAFSVTMIIAWSKAVVQAFRVQSEAETKLATVMKQRMGLGKEAVESLKKQASAYQKIGVIGDEIQLAGLQQLATFVHQKESLDAMLPAMNNLLAQQKGYNASASDAVNIANMMGRALTGQLGSLSRVGITFTEAQGKALKLGTETERAAAMAEILTANVGNMNEEMGKTDLGKITQMTNALGDLKEAWGEWLVRAPVIGAFRSYFTDLLTAWADESYKFGQKAAMLLPYYGGQKGEKVTWKRGQQQVEKERAAEGVSSLIGILRFLERTGKAAEKTERTIADLRVEIAEYKELLEGTTESDQASRDEHLKQIKTLEDLIMKYTTLEEILTRAEAISKISGLKVPAVSTGIPVLPGIQPFGGTVATGEEIASRQVTEMTEALEEQIVAVNILSSSFNALFTSTEDGFKAMIDSIIMGIKRLLAELLARVAVLALLNIITGGSASFATILKGATASMGFAKGASGGTVPPGFHGDTYPALLSTGETILTSQQSSWFQSGKLDIEVHGTWLGRELSIGGRRTSRFN